MTIYHINGIEIRVTRRIQAVNARITHKTGCDYFALSVPKYCTEQHIQQYVKNSMSWIQKQLDKEKEVWRPELACGERGWLQGKLVTLGKNGIPDGNDFLKLRNNVLKNIVAGLLPLWQQRMHVSASIIRFRDMSSRWGSCNVRTGVITLNTRLGAMPEELTEYILVHELNHLIHQDHSAAFHQEMTRWLPDWKARKQKLDRFGPLILPPEEGSIHARK